MKRRPTVTETDLPAPAGVKKTKTTVRHQSQKGKSYTIHESITTSITNKTPAKSVKESLKQNSGSSCDELLKDMEEMMSAYEGDDFDTICSVSHKIAGNAGGYGFDAMGDIAREMEHESKDGKDKEKIKGYLDGIRNYLDNVEITYE